MSGDEQKRRVPPLRVFFRQVVQLQGIRIKPTIYHDYVCDQIEHVIYKHPGYENIRAVLINIPPGFGKTKILEIAMLHQFAWFSNSHMLYICNTADNATRSVKYIRDMMVSEWFRSMFPWCKIGNKNANDEFETSEGGHIQAFGLEGEIIGKGAGLSTQPCSGFSGCDDLNKPGEIGSEVSQVNVNARAAYIESRSRGGTSKHPIIHIQQRLGHTDVSAWLLERHGTPKRADPNGPPHPDDKLLHIKIPCLVKIDGVEQTISDSIISTADLVEKRDCLPGQFYAQFQQEPQIEGGNLIQVGRFLCDQAFDTNDLWDRKIITCDSAEKQRESNDWSVFQCWGGLNRKAYLIDQIRGRWTSPQLIEMGEAMYTRHNQGGVNGSYLHAFLIEDKSSGVGLLQHLQSKGIPCQAIQRGGNSNKPLRVSAVLPYIHGGFVYLNKNLPTTDDSSLAGFKSECGAFRQDMKHQFDDQVDPMCDAILDLLGPVVSSVDAFMSTTKGKLIDYYPGGKYYHGPR